MAIIKVVPFPGAPGPAGPSGPQGEPGISGVAAASAPLTYDAETNTVGIDQEGFNRIGTLDYAKFDTNPSIIIGGGQEGIFAWDAYHETMRVGVGYNATLDIGQEFHIPVYNISGEDIMKGTVVMAELDNDGRIRTLDGGKFRVTKAITNGVFDAKFVLGIAITDIFNGNGGLITNQGHIHDINIDSWELGDILWADPANPGGLTTTRPVAPALKLPLATVVYVGENEIGTLYVRLTSGSYLGRTDHNVEITNPQDGDILKYNGTTGVWYNAQP